MTERTKERNTAQSISGSGLPYQMALLAMNLEAHKEIQRLEKRIEVIEVKNQHSYLYRSQLRGSIKKAPEEPEAFCGPFHKIAVLLFQHNLMHSDRLRSQVFNYIPVNGGRNNNNI